MSSSGSPGEGLTEQARNAGVPPPPAHVGPNAAAAAVGPLEKSSGQQGPNFPGARREGSPNQLSPDDSGSRRPPPVRQPRPMDGRRDEDSLADLLSPSSSSRRPAQGRLGAAPDGFSLLEVIGFCFLTFNNVMARDENGSVRIRIRIMSIMSDKI